MSSSDRYILLGEFIRSRREQLPPPARATGRRRTPGMRREELAEAAAVSSTWVTWLEQGREVAASVNALARLADALRLDSAERATLFDLAGKRDPIPHTESKINLTPSILNLPALLTVPAYLLDPTWTAQTWNAAAEKLFVGWLDQASTDRNLLRFVFLAPSAQTLIADWPGRCRRLVAEFRADYSKNPDDVEMQELINHLLGKSDLFAHYWKEQSVLHRDGGARSFYHPVLGQQNFLQTTLIVASHQECKLVCLAPVAT